MGTKACDDCYVHNEHRTGLVCAKHVEEREKRAAEAAKHEAIEKARAVMARVALRTMPDGSPCFCVVAVNPHHLSCACARAFIGHKPEAT